jgi:hypothetical protein
MNYSKFCGILQAELPLNRKERFYTGTILPALLFHRGLTNFYKFLEYIKDFPSEISESTTSDNFLFYTEYNLKESGGDRSIGVKFNARTNETPDVVIEILRPKKVFIVIEAKMFAKVRQDELTKQIRRQKTTITSELRKELGGEKFYHLALVPAKLGIKNTEEYQVINWEFFINNKELNVQDSFFYNYLRFALERYDEHVSLSVGGDPPTTVEFYMKGLALYEFYEENPTFWIGRMGGEKKIQEDAMHGKWRKHSYCVNSKKPLKGQPGNWIPLQRFIELIDKYGE